MSFGGGGGGTSTTTNKVEPYAPATPALNQIISEAGTIYGQGPAGTGYVAPSTQTIQGSFNVGSITDNATGVTITNYTNNMNDALYSVVGSNDGAVKAYYQHQFYSETTSSVYTYNSPDYSLNNADGVVCTAILGDLA